jgi:hypothetical protein
MIPLSTPYLIAIGAVVTFLAGAAGGWAARGVIADRAVAELQASIAQERQRSADAARAAEARARETEQRRAAAVERIERESFQRNQTLAADAAAARRAADSLRQHVARLAAGGQTASDPTPAGSSTPADPASGMLAVVLGQAVDRAAELAAFADAAHSAGLACERAWETLK